MVCGFIRGQRDLRSQPHQLHFVIALYHPATGCDWSGAGNFHLWRSLADTLAENEAHGFFHA